MKIDIIKLRQIVNLLLDKIENKNGNLFEIDVDFYWDISFDEVYNPYEEPKNISLGQLSDDLNVIANLYQDPSNMVIYDLKRVSEILKAISMASNIIDL